MSMKIEAIPRFKPELDPEYMPAVIWNREYRKAVTESGREQPIVIALERPDGTVSTFAAAIFPHSGEYRAINVKYVERLVKFLLWMKGGYKIIIAGCDKLAQDIAAIYSPGGKRAFDNELIGVKVYGCPLEIVACPLDEAPASHETQVALGGHLDGCRIGFDLGGSDRKCAALINGEVVHSEEVEWDPYFRKDPAWHKAGIMDSLKRAAAKLPRVDCIGGSAAGIYVDNQVRIASLFRGVSEDDFKNHVRNMFLEIQKEWNNVPLVVANDGDVTALAGAMSMNATGVLGLSMGTSQAVGYVNLEGNVTGWLNELAFAPVDYRDDAPVDEWSGDNGCGVQYFSQQAVARLAPAAGFDFPDSMPFPERLVEVQKKIEEGDGRAAKIYRTIGTYFAYAVAHYAEFYEIRNLLILGRVTSGKGGDLILEVAEDILKKEYPEIARLITFRTPDEKFKRHGQAVIAASLPAIN